MKTGTPTIPSIPSILAILVTLAGASVSGLAQTGDVSWPGFLSRQDMIWTRNPYGWDDAAFIGNGRLGAMIYMQAGQLGWEINRSDLTHETSRYPVGRIVLKTTGQVTGGSARLALWDAEAAGTLRTSRGTVEWRSYTATTPSVIMISLRGTGDERDCTLAWEPAEARAPRKTVRKEQLGPDDLHPPAEVRTEGDTITSTQTFIKGGAHAESILFAGRQPDGSKIWYASIGLSDAEEKNTAANPAAPPPSPAAALSAALAEARAWTSAAATLGPDRLTEAHRAWWHAYYPASFLSIPDARLESFYWLQIYKLGSAMREDGPILDLMGPWYRQTAWARIWWNLNIQLTYSPLFAANRLPQSESLFRALDRNLENLKRNVPGHHQGRAAAIGTNSGYDLVSPVNWARALANNGRAEVGNLPWIAYLYWQYYRHQMDATLLRERLLPFLKPAIGHYLAFTRKGDDGRWHLPRSYSPELDAVEDCNYDLALFRWGLQTLIRSHEHLRLDDPDLPRWREVLAGLTPPPEDESGLLVGRGLPLAESHRHFSHLLSIYPLRLLTPDTPETRVLIEKSLANWIGRPQRLAGYSWTGVAAMSALMGNGDAALDYLNQLLHRAIKPNTFYSEGGNFPVIETPFSAAASLQEMLFQSWGGKLRVFPAIPPAWSESAFADLRGEGAFLVSAVRHVGKTTWVRVKSLAGSPCRIVVGDWKNAVLRTYSGTGDESAPVLRKTNANDAGIPCEFELTLPKGAWAILSETATTDLLPLLPASTASADHNPYPMRHRPE
ncbi:MAG: hypothetical protein LBK99_24745 [Opitutaceae bacterium]|jgi:hypothetical protein|nr:hypothetical protein [Opitutaceae bacterium]